MLPVLCRSECGEFGLTQHVISAYRDVCSVHTDATHLRGCAQHIHAISRVMEPHRGKVISQIDAHSDLDQCSAPLVATAASGSRLIALTRYCRH